VLDALQPAPATGLAAAEPRRLWQRRPMATVTLAATLLAIAVTWPLVLHLSDSIYGYPGDSTGTIAIFWWFGYALHHGLPVLNNTMLGGNLGSGWALMYVGVIELFVFGPLSFLFGPTVAYNLGVLSSWPLTALATFPFARRLGMSNLAAAFSALAFAFVPFHEEKAMGHMEQAHMEVFPAFTLLVLRWRQGGSWWNLAGAGAMAAITLWLDPYFAFILAALAAGLLVLSVLWDARFPSWRARVIAHLRAVAVVAGVAIVGTLPAYLVARRGGVSIAAQAGVAHRSLGEVAIYSARLREYVLPWHFNPLVPDSLKQFEAAALHGSNFTEQTLLLGYTVLVLSVAGLLLFPGRLARVVALAVAVIGFGMAQPPIRPLFGISIPAPSYLLYAVLPFFRVYSRFAILTMLGCALLAGLGLTALAVRAGPGRRRFLLLIPFLTLALEFNSLPPTHTYQLFPAPAEYLWLRAQPAGTLVEYPLVYGPKAQPGQFPEGSANPNTIEIETRQYDFYQQVHLHGLFNGAVTSTPADLIAPRLEPYYGAGVAQRLAAIGIRYVFVHRDNYAAAGFALPREVPGLTYLQTIDGTDIYLTSAATSAVLCVSCHTFEAGVFSTGTADQAFSEL
jgi:hypothetical protein